MTAIVWDDPASKTYETGIDQGVLYLSDGSGVPWNGLTSVEERFAATVATPLFFEGEKFNESMTVSDYSASLKAFTYPEEFMEYEGIQEADPGFYVTAQTPKRFGLSYRTRVGNGLDPDAGYRIHVVTNLTAVPSPRAYKTIGANPAAIEFEWIISAIPSRIPGFRSTAHLIFDSTRIDPDLLNIIENTIYGTEDSIPTLLPLPEMVALADIT